MQVSSSDECGIRVMLYACAQCVYPLQVLTTDLEFVRHIENEGLAGRSCTGIAVSNNGLVVVNWRTKTVTELSPIHGDTLFKFSHNAFQVKRPIVLYCDRVPAANAP